MTYLYAIAPGRSVAELRKLPEAIAAYETALKLSPGANRWKNEEILARLCHDNGDRTNSSLHLQHAIELAPANQRTGLVNLQKKLFGGP